MSLKSAFLMMALLIASSQAHAATSLQVCVDKTGKLLAAAKCAKGQTRLTTQNLGAFGLQGAQGPAGLVNTAACRGVSNTCHLTGPGTCSVSCNNGEFVLQHASGFDGTVFSLNRFYYPTAYSNQLGASILYDINAVVSQGGTPSGDVTIYAECCPLN